jgi:Ca2+-binding RTX toxin-like protein
VTDLVDSGGTLSVAAWNGSTAGAELGIIGTALSASRTSLTGTVFAVAQPSLDGGAGRDDIDGSPGNDRITGGLGEDNVSGGGGIDTWSSSATPISPPHRLAWRRRARIRYPLSGPRSPAD